MNTVQSMWGEYFKSVLAPAGVKEGSIQYLETRRAFYAGAGATLSSVVQISNEMSEDAATKVLTGMSDELQQFFLSQVVRG